MTFEQALNDGAQRLAEAGIEGSARDARWLMANVAGLSAAKLSAVSTDAVPAHISSQFEAAIARRAAYEPVAQILGEKEFFGRAFETTKDTLTPRPETELLVEQASAQKPKRILDLGTGTGCLAISVLAECQNADGVAVDISSAALEVAARNAKRHGVAGRLDLRQSDWFENVEGQFDCILCNPPYIAEDDYPSLAPDVRNWEPQLALTAVNNGLAAFEIIARNLVGFLSPGGVAIFEFGLGQAHDIRAIFEQSGFSETCVLEDLSARPRALRVRKTNSG